MRRMEEDIAVAVLYVQMCVPEPSNKRKCFHAPTDQTKSNAYAQMANWRLFSLKYKQKFKPVGVQNRPSLDEQVAGQTAGNSNTDNQV